MLLTIPGCSVIVAAVRNDAVPALFADRFSFVETSL
jgi:hypothetical protein